MKWVVCSLLISVAGVLTRGYIDIFDRGGFFPIWIYGLAFSGSLLLAMAGTLSLARHLRLFFYIVCFFSLTCNVGTVIAMRKYPEGATLEIVLRHEPSLNTKEELLGVYLQHFFRRIRLDCRNVRSNAQLEIVQANIDMGIRAGTYELVFEPSDVFESQSVFLRNDNTLVDTVALRKLHSKVTFMTDPIGAVVGLDPLPNGISRNWRTTHTFPRFPRGIYKLTFSKDGYDTVKVVTAINRPNIIIDMTLRNAVTLVTGRDTQRIDTPRILEEDSLILLMIAERDLLNYLDLYLYGNEVDSAMNLINRSLVDRTISNDTKSKLRNIKVMLQKGALK